jgi:serine/threonine protein kinase
MRTQTPSGTFQYEPPEMDEKRNSQAPRLRHHNIWSLGCVIFELLLWLTYDPSDIRIFRNNTPYFWQKGYRREHGTHIVDEYVVAVIERLDSHFQPSSAYKDLLDLVRNRLLVVKYSADYAIVLGDCRESATKVHQCFADIAKKCEPDKNLNYLTPF